MTPTTRPPQTDSTTTIPAVPAAVPPRTTEATPAERYSTAEFRERLLDHFRTARNVALSQAAGE